MLRRVSTYEEAKGTFRWDIPASYNIAADVVDRHAAATPDAAALICETAAGAVSTYSFRQIRGLANRCANMLRAHGTARGDRIAILLSQQVETAVAHVAAWKLGAVSIPLFTAFGQDALEFRLADSGAKVLITDLANYPKVAALRASLAGLRRIFIIDGEDSGAASFWSEIEKASESFSNEATAADDPAFLVYTSGTTGQPKGALHAHRAMIGHMPGFDIVHEFFDRPDDLSWSPADWAWIAGLMDVLFPTWFSGKPVLAFRPPGPFDPELAYHMMRKHAVRNAFLVPTMLKLMRQTANPPSLKLSTILCGGETVGPELHEWGRAHFGVPLNEGYGQTECNLVLAHAPALMKPKFGALGLPPPGHEAAIVDDDGNELPPGTDGNIAFRRGDPVMMLGYWGNPEATAHKYAGDWLLTGDVGRRDEDGYFWFVGRADDVITSGGYRIGPGEIEDCLLKHPAIAAAAVIGVPDPVRTEIIKAFIMLAPGRTPSESLEAEIRGFVRDRLARHDTPRQIMFVDRLPMTATGKIMRRVLKQQEEARLAAEGRVRN